jgi:oligopeptide/dipeptide ABC transporter ATP-binding protein
VPVPDTRRRQERERILLSGDVPSPIKPPPACRFHTRCWKAQEICRTQEPPLVELVSRHHVACHFPENYPPENNSDAAARASAPDGTLR